MMLALFIFTMSYVCHLKRTQHALCLLSFMLYSALKWAVCSRYCTLCHINVLIVIAHIACLLQSPCFLLMFELYKRFSEALSEKKVILCIIITVNLSHSTSDSVSFSVSDQTRSVFIVQLFSMFSSYQSFSLGCGAGLICEDNHGIKRSIVNQDQRCIFVRFLLV